MRLFRRKKRRDDERFVMREPPDRTWWAFLCLILAVPPPLLFGLMAALWSGVMFAAWIALEWNSRWRIVVTTRRILVRPGWLRREVLDIPFGSITDTRYDDGTSTLVITADGADYPIRCPAEMAAVVDALRQGPADDETRAHGSTGSP